MSSNMVFNESIYFAIFCIFLSMLFLWRKFSTNQNNPPGPFALPIIGHMHLLGSDSLHIICERLSRIYGDIFTLQLAARKVVVLCSREAIFEAFVKNAKSVAGRPDLPTFLETRRGKIGLSLCDYSEQYHSNRKSAVRAMHNFLTDKENLDKCLRGEASKMVALLDDCVMERKSYIPLDQFNKIIPSMFLKMMLGIECGYDDKFFTDIVQVYKSWFEAAEADNPADFIPFLQHFPNERLRTVANCGKRFDEFVAPFLESDSSDELKSIHQELLLEGSNGNEEKPTDQQKAEIGKIIADIIGGGFDTSAAVMSWALLYLNQQRNVLQKCRQELEIVLKDSRFVSINNRADLPYLAATIYEIIRLSTVAPMGLPRKVLNDHVMLGGYTIEKDTIIMPNLWAVNHDPKVWPDPDVLRPTRLMDTKGEIDRHMVNNVLSFSLGVRRCPGDQFAFSMIFVILGTLIKNYEFIISKPPIDMIPQRGITLKPKPYEVLFTERL